MLLVCRKNIFLVILYSSNVHTCFQYSKKLYGCFFRLVSGAGDIKLTKDGNVLLHEMVRALTCCISKCYMYIRMVQINDNTFTCHINF